MNRLPFPNDTRWVDRDVMVTDGSDAWVNWILIWSDAEIPTTSSLCHHAGPSLCCTTEMWLSSSMIQSEPGCPLGSVVLRRLRSRSCLVISELCISVLIAETVDIDTPQEENQLLPWSVAGGQLYFPCSKRKGRYLSRQATGANASWFAEGEEVSIFVSILVCDVYIWAPWPAFEATPPLKENVLHASLWSVLDLPGIQVCPWAFFNYRLKLDPTWWYFAVML